MAKLSELIQKISEHHPNNIARTDVKGIIESLAEKGYKELKRTGAFFVPGFTKFVVVKKARHKGAERHQSIRKGPAIFKAKPARKIIGLGPVKAAKDAV